MTEAVQLVTEETTRFTIGADASCSDGVCGEVSRVVVDPLARALTHIVVEPKQRRGLGKLVPLELVDATTGEVQLGCTLAEFEKLKAAEETQFLPGTGGYPGYDAGHVVSWPYYGMGGVMRGGMGLGMGNISHPVTFDVVPVGEVAVRRGESVHASDGDIGRVQGLIIDGDHRVTHVLLQEGHLWGRNDVAIPISAVTGVGDDGIALSISKQEVQDLPPVEVDRSL
jgi:sporulation protein YlmC with PRC-barrel domain